MRISKPNLHNFGIVMSLTRLLGVMFIVFSTYNPSGWSIWHWFEVAWPRDWMLLLPVTLLYLFVYIYLFMETYRSLRVIGIALAVAFMGSIVWVLSDAGLIAISELRDIGVAVLYMVGGLLATGLVWAGAWLTLTGQVTVDDLTS